ncbi:MAG: hypothetical protein ACYDAN_04485 [Candidatus Limnocylindrales bacterium]
MTQGRAPALITGVVAAVSAFWAVHLISDVLGMDFRFVLRDTYAGPFAR